MGRNDKNFRSITLRNVFLIAGLVMLVASIEVKAQPAHAICWWISLVMLVSALVQMILYRINPDWFRDKTPYDEIPGRITRQSDPK